MELEEANVRMPVVSVSVGEGGGGRSRSGEPSAWRAWLPLAVIMVMAAAVRVMFLSQFPDVQTDEGLWTNATKNRLLFGDWFMDGRGHFFLSPVFHILSLTPFVAMGPSIEAARWVSALAGVGSVALSYILALRLTGARPVALTTALLMALDPWAVITSRQALTESTLVFFVLASAVLVVGRTRREVAAAGILFAIAILTKLSALAMGLVLGLYLLLRQPEAVPFANIRRVWVWRLTEGGIFGALALGFAAVGYGALSRIDPALFVEVFSRELGGEHVGAAREAGGVLGRIGIHPVDAGRALLDVVRANPFLFVLGAVGGAVAWSERHPARLFLLLWTGMALVFPMTQVYQPLRYFFPVVPGLAILAATCLHRIGGGGERWASRPLVAAVGVVLLVNAAYLVANFAANRGNQAAEVATWLGRNADPADPVLASTVFATDPPNPVYAFDRVASTRDDLEAFVERVGVRFVVWDAEEWPPGMGEFLAHRYDEVHRWPFGVVFETDAPRR